MDGFQYTNNTLDFFPHTSTALSAGSGGYVKALAAGLGGGTSYDFKYVFTYTDHTSAALSTGLGNIRLKYAQDPSNNNQISILEEDPRSRAPEASGASRGFPNFSVVTVLSFSFLNLGWNIPEAYGASAAIKYFKLDSKKLLSLG